MLGDVGRLGAVSVDEARKLANELVFRRVAVMGETGPTVAEARRRLAIDDVRDTVFNLRIGATVGAVYVSGILGTGGAFTGVVDVVAIGLFIDGNNFSVLRISKLSLRVNVRIDRLGRG